MANRTVVAAGPDPDWDGNDEVPIWTVAIENDDGDVVSKVYTTRSREAAIRLMKADGTRPPPAVAGRNIRRLMSSLDATHLT